jgi:hypothetical protein
MVKCGVLFEVRTEFLSAIQTRFFFKGLINDAFLLGMLIYGRMGRRLNCDELEKI